MAARPYVIYRLLKVKIDMGHGGSDGQILAYVLYDNRGVRLCHGRLVNPDEEKLDHGIKIKWREFCSFVDKDRIDVSETEEDDGEFSAEELEFSAMMKELRKALDDVGVYDMTEENLTKLKYMEKIFDRIAGFIYAADRFVFLKVEALSTLEGEELMSGFPEERDENEPWRPSSHDGSSQAGERELPKAIFSCSVLLDPVAGVAASDLRIGQQVWLDVPSDSLLYSIAKFRQGASFQGTITGEVVSVEQSDTERLLVLFKLSDELKAVSVVQKNLKVKTVAQENGEALSIFSRLSRDQLLALGGVAFFMIVVLLLLILR